MKNIKIWFKNLFAKKPKYFRGLVNEEMIKDANIWNSTDCIGARFANSILQLPKGQYVKWGVGNGVVYDEVEDRVVASISTHPFTDMMEIKKPQLVELIVEYESN